MLIMMAQSVFQLKNFLFSKKCIRNLVLLLGNEIMFWLVGSAHGVMAKVIVDLKLVSSNFGRCLWCNGYRHKK